MQKSFLVKGLVVLTLATICISAPRMIFASDTPPPKENALGRPFDPNRRAAENINNVPLSEIISVPNGDGSFDVIWRDGSQPTPKLYLAKFTKSGNGYSQTNIEELPGLGMLAGFTKDDQGNIYYMTAEYPKEEQERRMTIYKNKQVFWEFKAYAGDDKPCTKPKVPLDSGSSQIAVGAGKLMIDTNIHPAHAYNVLLDLIKPETNSAVCARETLWHHNFGNRIIFDGKDFVALENRDHEVTISMMKFSPTEKYPFEAYAERLRSVYARTNHGNSTYTELGDIALGLDDGNGYLVLFTSERDWDDQMEGQRVAGGQGGIGGELGPRDLAVIHVKKDFDKQEVNWKGTATELKNDGNIISQAPKLVDTTGVVNSIGTGKTVNYKAANDGWDWPNYNKDIANLIASGELAERAYKTGGVNWLTDFGVPFENATRLPTKAPKDGAKGEMFKTVKHPKLVRLATNNYVVIWEEHNAYRSHDGSIEHSYITTKAMTLKLSSEGSNVRITKGNVKDLGNKVRLMPIDDAFNLDGKAAFVTGDQTSYSLKLHTIDSNLNLEVIDLPVWEKAKLAALIPQPEIGFFRGNEFSQYNGTYITNFPADEFFINWRFKQGFLWHPNELEFRLYAPDGKLITDFKPTYENTWQVDVGNNDRGQGRFQLEVYVKGNPTPIAKAYFVRGADTGEKPVP